MDADEEETPVKRPARWKGSRWRKAVWGKTQKDVNCQSMTGPKRKSCTADEMKLVSCVQ